MCVISELSSQKTVWIKNKYVSKLLTANETALNLIPQCPTPQPNMTCFHCVPEADGYLDKTHHSFQPTQTESSFHRSRIRQRSSPENPKHTNALMWKRGTCSDSWFLKSKQCIRCSPCCVTNRDDGKRVWTWCWFIQLPPFCQETKQSLFDFVPRMISRHN